ncbi:MAG: histidine-type phosphatase [Bacteroidales bacterium]|nr:histidine-type phosphatase [Bacteroidales bacterium]MBO4446519.1 histidine-type phosphatase [Bacteroidales bacterium]
MKLLLLYLTAILVAPPAGPALQMLREDPDRAGVNNHVYEFVKEYDTPAPAGYKPYYLLHYGRHGSRNEFKSKYYEELAHILQQARDGGFLSDDGEKLLVQTRQIIVAHRDSPGHLTRLGEAEHRELARRIYKRYKPVFTKGPRQIYVESSTVPRTLVSMTNFTGELIRLQKDLDISIDSDERVFSYVNNSCSKDMSAKIYKLTDSLAALMPVDTVQIYRRLFTDPEKGKALEPDAEKFQRYIFNTALIAKSCAIEGSPYDFLTEDVIYKWWARIVRRLYLRQCNSVEFGHLRLPRSKPLVDTVFRHLDEAVTSAPVAANLMFGHDHPLLGLASYLRLEGIGDRLTMDEITEKWYDPTNIPFASNMQIILYRNKAGKVLVKFVYNGRERAVHGLTPVSGPYYSWEDVSTLRNYKE